MTQRTITGAGFTGITPAYAVKAQFAMAPLAHRGYMRNRAIIAGAGQQWPALKIPMAYLKGGL